VEPSKRLERDGFLVAPRVLTRHEITTLRAQVDAEIDRLGVAFGLGTVVPAAATSSALAPTFAHAAVVDAVRDALGEERIVFTMESGLHRNVTGPWHDDLGTHTVEGGYYGTPAVHARADCRVVKVAIYLQDQDGERSLCVRAGTHRRPDLDDGPVIRLDTRAGDVVVFDARLAHRGQAPGRLDSAIVSAARVAPRSARGDVVASVRRLRNRWCRRADRLAVFSAFGPDNEMTERYARRNLDRELAQAGHSVADPPSDLLARFSALGVGVVPGPAVAV